MSGLVVVIFWDRNNPGSSWCLWTSNGAIVVHEEGASSLVVGMVVVGAAVEGYVVGTAAEGNAVGVAVALVSLVLVVAL